MAAGLVGIAALVLAYEPVLWLLQTWRDPAYGSHGAVVATLALGLMAWSVTSPRQDKAAPAAWRLALGLFVLAAALRALGQVLAINTLAALTLVVDAYALARLAGVEHRVRSLSPLWLAAIFAFSFPLERILQRTIAHPLQLASADGACGVLGLFFSNLDCEGMRLRLEGVDVLVDLPCSGARTALAALLGFALVAAVVRPTVRQAALGVVTTLLAAYVANVLRISLLATGIGRPDLVANLDVMAWPTHDLIGLFALVGALVPVGIWARAVLTSARPSGRAPEGGGQGAWAGAPTGLEGPNHGPGSGWPAIGIGGAAVGLAILIVVLPNRPVDVAERRAPDGLALPTAISGTLGETTPLTAREAHYFSAFGGRASKAVYGPHALLVIETSSPLRHLHDPVECLRGLGFSVRYVGQSFAPLPTAIFDARAPSSERYRIDVTYISDRGTMTASVATAVWSWLNGWSARWTAVQRISPADLSPARHAQWSAAVMEALAAQEVAR